jgi:hypothetical protein
METPPDGPRVMNDATGILLFTDWSGRAHNRHITRRFRINVLCLALSDVTLNNDMSAFLEISCVCTYKTVLRPEIRLLERHITLSYTHSTVELYIP